MPSPVAYVAHASSGRVRLRVGGSPEEHARALDELAQKLGGHPSVREIRASARTGSILILFEGELEPLLDRVRELLHWEIEAPPRTPMLRLERALKQTEARLTERTQGRVTLGHLTFLGTLAGGAWQTGKGRLLPAGLTLLDYALQALQREAAKEREDLQRSS